MTRMRLSLLFATGLACFAQAPSLDQLKNEALAMIDAWRQLTQQIVDSIFSFSELGFQRPTPRPMSGAC